MRNKPQATIRAPPIRFQKNGSIYFNKLRKEQSVVGLCDVHK